MKRFFESLLNEKSYCYVNYELTDKVVLALSLLGYL